jgi:HEAT repeat protein
MRASVLWLVLIGAWSVVADAAEPAEPIRFEGAKWIWGGGSQAATPSAGACYFRAEIDVPENPPLKSAELIATCDNLFILHLNGIPVGESETGNSAWHNARRWDVTNLIAPGRIVVAAEGINTLPGAAGLLVKFVAELADGERVVLASDEQWKSHSQEAANWQQPEFDDQRWDRAAVVGEYGARPWGRVALPPTAAPGGQSVGAVARAAREVRHQATRQGHVGPVVELEPAADFEWPAAIAFLADDCSLYRTPGRDGTACDSLNVTIFNPRKSRAFPEHDLPAPMKIGRKLVALSPARPGTQPRLLVDAGRGALGSPSVTFDGDAILVSMAYDDEPFFHVYRIPTAGGAPQRLTDGPFHDIDPVELPDGRIVFTSTRIGRFEEYHNPPSRSLFVMHPDGSDVRPLTHTIIFDNEPEILADGRIVFIRSDNFFDRGKVETLLHAIHPDGAGGYTEFGLNNRPEYGGRLRAYVCGSPAPLPDGRLAFLSAPGITVGKLGYPPQHLQHLSIPAGDVAALPDGRLLCTTAVNVSREIGQGQAKKTIQEPSYEKIAIVDADSRPPRLTVLYVSDGQPLHSPVFLGPRPRPLQLATKVDAARDRDPQATGILYCQNARYTQKTTAGWPHVRAIRVLAGEGLTVRSSHSYIVHAGSLVRDLGTVPLAPDGSFAVEVPADTPIALQAVDAEGRSELNEMSWIYLRPGERRGCIGCHHDRQVAPLRTETLPQALRSRPLRLTGEGEPLRFRGNNAAVTGLMELQFDRYREVAGIDRHDRSRDPSDSSEEVAALVAQLQGLESGRLWPTTAGRGSVHPTTAGRGSDWDAAAIQISAASRLSVFRDPQAAPVLADQLGAPLRELRVAAALALASCGTRASVPPLLDALADREPLVAQAAAVALENLTGQASAFEAFAPREQRQLQAEAWRQWFDERSWDDIEQALLARLASADRDVVRRAAVALGHTGSAAACEPLRRYLAEHREINPYPEWKKTHKVDGTRFNALSEANPRTLQAVTRSLGYLRDAAAVPLLAETLAQHDHPDTGNLFLAEAVVEALGRIGTPEAEAALIEGLAALDEYPQYTLWYGDHPALMACHASPVHYLIASALASLGTTRGHAVLPCLIRALPVDQDRALLLENDDCETLTGRVLRRHGVEAAVVETCLAMLGDERAARDAAWEQALSATHRCWGGHPGPEIRAAQVLSLVVRDPKYAPAIQAALVRYQARPVTIPRVFDQGIPVVLELPVKHWVCFFLARALGNLADPDTAAPLLAVLASSAPEAAEGHPDPLGPGVLFLHNDLTPCWRAAVVWALGQIGDRRAVPVLLALVADLANSPDTRHTAAVALGRLAAPADADALLALADGYPEESTRRALVQAHRRCQQLAGGD